MSLLGLRPAPGPPSALTSSYAKSFLRENPSPISLSSFLSPHEVVCTSSLPFLFLFFSSQNLPIFSFSSPPLLFLRGCCPHGMSDFSTQPLESTHQGRRWPFLKYNIVSSMKIELESES